jgi:hypothetical protein
MRGTQRDAIAGQRPECLSRELAPTRVLIKRRRYCENFFQERLRFCDVRAPDVLVALPDSVLHTRQGR